MGGVGKTLFGGPAKSSGHSYNRNYSEVSDAMTPAMGYVTQGGGMMGNLLGVNGGAAQREGLDNFTNSGGMEFLREQGNNQINSNQAAKGLLESGSTLKELTKYGQGLGSTYLNQYMEHLGKLAGIGLGATGQMVGVGQVNKQKSQGEKEGILPKLAAGIPIPA